MKDIVSLRGAIALVLLAIIATGFSLTVIEVPFGTPDTKVGTYYVESGREETGAANIVTSVVTSYRALDTLGEVTVLFVAAMGLSAVLAIGEKKKEREVEKSSLVLSTGCRALFPFILLLGAYLFLHGHLTPGGGFQGGAVIGSAFLLVYLGYPESRISTTSTDITESLGGFALVIIGLIGFVLGGSYFLSNFLPKGELYSLFSAGILPLIYIAIGLKVGAEFGGIIDRMMEET